MELPSKLLHQIAFNTRHKIEEHMLIVMDKSTPEELFSQPFKTNNKQFKIAVTFLTGCNGIFNVTSKKNNFYFVKEDGCIQTLIPKGAFELETLNNETKRIIIEEENYTEANYSFTIEPKFSTLGSVIEISSQRTVTSFAPNGSVRGLLGFNATTIYEEYKL